MVAIQRRSCAMAAGNVTLERWQVAGGCVTGLQSQCYVNRLRAGDESLGEYKLTTGRHSQARRFGEPGVGQRPTALRSGRLYPINPSIARGLRHQVIGVGSLLAGDSYFEILLRNTYGDRSRAS